MANGHARESFRYREVEQSIQGMIDAGTLLPGQKTPSLRGLATKLSVSVTTVSQAYAELERKGLIESKPRSGFFVRSDFRQLCCPSNKKEVTPAPKAVKQSALIQSVLASIGDKCMLSTLGLATPQADLLPYKALSRAMTSVLRDQSRKLIGYECVSGNVDLRRQIAFRAVDTGVTVSPDEIIITNGAVEAVHIALRCLTRPGDNVLIQSPCFFCFFQVLEDLGLRAIEVPSRCTGGVSPVDVEKALNRYDIKACLLSLNFNNPDGSLVPDAAKKEIVDLLSTRNVPLIEDDVFGEIYFGGTRPPSCRKYDTKGLVTVCSSFSKTIAPGYRIGWMIPGGYLNRALEVKTTMNITTSSPIQMALAEYLSGSHFDRQLKRLRVAIEKQMATIRHHVGRYFPEGTKASNPAGGGMLWMQLPGNVDSIEFFHAAQSQHIGVTPGAIFSTGDKYDGNIRLNCGNAWTEEMKEGIRQLGKLAARMGK